jgi:hypothetical protein
MSSWTFLTNHVQVLLCVARNSTITAREIAGQVGITANGCVELSGV